MCKRFAAEAIGAWLVLIFVFLLSAAAVTAQDNVVISTNFEKGTQKWERRGDVSISSTRKQAAEGKKSLRVSGRREFWQGAQLNITNKLTPGRKYRFSVLVKLAEGEDPDAVKLTMQIGDNKWAGVAGIEANDKEWRTLSGEYKPDGSEPFMLIYVEAVRPRTSYFIDDFKIELMEPPKQAGQLLKNDFQDGTAQNWTVRGENVKYFSATEGDNRSLKIAGRTDSSHGLALDLSQIFFKDRTYRLSVLAKLVEGEEPDLLKISIVEVAPGGVTETKRVSLNTMVTDGKWVRLFGDYTVSSEENNHIVLVEASRKTTSYYIDEFEVEIP